MIDDRIIDIPSYIVSINEEQEIHLAPKSTLKNLLQAKPADAEPEPVAQESQS
jgi:ribosomal protein S4